jgi:hypothetical protein
MTRGRERRGCVDVSAVPMAFLFDREGRAASVLYGAPPSLQADAQAELASLLP